MEKSLDLLTPAVPLSLFPERCPCETQNRRCHICLAASTHFVSQAFPVPVSDSRVCNCRRLCLRRWTGTHCTEGSFTTDFIPFSYDPWNKSKHALERAFVKQTDYTDPEWNTSYTLNPDFTGTLWSQPAWVCSPKCWISWDGKYKLYVSDIRLYL